MIKRIMTPVLVILIAAFSYTGLQAEQTVSVGEIELDRNEWGSRRVFIQVDNVVDDTAWINVVVYTIYPGHYLSGLERLEVDTTVAIEPKGVDDLVIPFKMHGSFGRIVTRVMVHWHYDRYVPEVEQPDSTFQIINSIFSGKGDADEYSGRKHCVGPVYSVMDHWLLNFEYPRLVLYLLGRGETPEAISDLFRADLEYTNEVISDLRGEGFFPLMNESLAPGLLPVSEQEGYGLKPKFAEAAEAFSSWYEESGQKQLDKILAEADLDDYARQLPSLQMPILYTLLMERWIDPEVGFGIPKFETMAEDINMLSRTNWIAQGGEFFLPKLCFGAFDENGRLHFGTFSPDPELPFDKASIYDMRGSVEKEAGSIITIEADQMRRVLTAARETKLTDKLAETMIKNIIDDPATTASLEHYKPYQRPYLIDYIIRVALGKYFIDHKPGQGLDCVQIGY
jgi:hypothetical protein